jgi:hypothetical protein
MPLARLVCQSDEQAAALTERLRALGYTVELVHPGQITPEPSDLELELEAVTANDALALAEAFDRQHPDGEIFIGPGVLAPGDLSPRGAAAPQRPGLISRLRALLRPGSRVETLELLAAPPATVVLAAPSATVTSAEFGPAAPAASFLANPNLANPGNAADAGDINPVAVDETVTPYVEGPPDEIQFCVEAPPREPQPGVEVEEPELLPQAISTPPDPVFFPAASQTFPLDMDRKEPLADMAAITDDREAVLPTLSEPATTSPASIARAQAIAPAKPAGEARAAAAYDRRNRAGNSLSHARGWALSALAGAAVAALLIGADWLAMNPRPAAPLSGAQVERSSHIEQQIPFGPVTIHNPDHATPAVRQQKPPAAVPVPSRGGRSPQKPSSAKVTHRHYGRHSHSGDYSQESNEVSVRHFAPASGAQTAKQQRITRISDN